MTSNRSIADIARSIVDELDVVLARPERVGAECRSLRALLSTPPDAGEVELLRTLASVLARRADPAVEPVVALLLEAAAACREPWPLLQEMLLARSREAALRALDLAARLSESGALVPDPGVAEFLAARTEAEGSALQGDTAFAAIARILRRLPAAAAGDADPVLALYERESGGRLRRLAARVLDLSGEPAPAAQAVRILGPDAEAALRPYLRYTRATHLDLLHIAPRPGATPRVLASVGAAEAACGEALLREVIAGLGWPAVSLGIEVRPRIGVSLGGSLPFWVLPCEAPLLESREGARRVFESFLVVAHGGLPPEEVADGTEAAEATDPVPRFRASNLAHAEVLADILEVGPLTREKVERLLARMDRLVEDFIALFAAHTDECAILPGVYGELKGKILAGLSEQQGDAPLSADLVRRVQMFEEPGSLGAVRTLHGLKRYLHQQGLKLGFRLVEAGRATNRTVGLALASRTRLLRVVQRIEYVDFEGEDGDGEAAARELGPGLRLPFAVALLADAFGLQVLHGQESFPRVKVFCYGNEVHYYAAFGNHPAFLRVDYAPPLQGGMIDLEYYGVSKYVLGEHPNPGLDALRAFFRRLDLDVQIENTRVHARYDKERVLDLAGLCEKAGATLRLVPYLMDLDWTIGDLGLGEAARRSVIEAWAARFERWGVVPAWRLLTPDRRGVRLGPVPGARGEPERVWTGEGEYRDRFGAPSPSFRVELAAALAGLGLDAPPLPGPGGNDLGQMDLDRHVLGPLRDAVARGELASGPGGLARAEPDRFEREHEAEAFAAILDGPDGSLAESARLACLVPSLERTLQFETTGSVNGHEVQRARLALLGEVIRLYVLRDGAGLTRLALFAPGETLWRRRKTADGAWERNGCRDAALLTAILRRNRYLPPGSAPAPAELAEEAEGLRGLFRAAAPIPIRALPGERAVTGLRISPGRASGTARFGTGGRRPEDLAGAVLVVSSLSPEDAPFLRHAAGIVSTGGGTLSHAALLAGQFRKPAVVVEGRWQREADGTASLACRMLEYAEEERKIGEWRIAERRSLRERECLLREGDLVVLNAELRTLLILGQDREALALHEELRRFGAASVRLGASASEEAVLELRGRRLRAAHQLRKLLDRLSDPPLARHAAHEILVGDALAAASADEKSRLLSFLLANPRARGPAREFLVQVAAGLNRRQEAAQEEALRRIPVSDSLYEVLAMRLEALRLRRARSGVAQALRACGLEDVAPAPPGVDLDGPARDRLGRLRVDRIRAAAAVPGPTTAGAPAARLRHLLRQAARIDEVLGAGTPDGDIGRRLEARLAGEDEAARARLDGRIVLGQTECGFELSDRIGWKAANLGEVERLAGSGRTPPWFVVTHQAFETALDVRVERPEAGGDGEAPEPPPLREIISAVLGRPDLDEEQKAARIRALWERLPLPQAIEREVRAAYRRLGEEPAADPPPGGDEGGVFVAVRSSACEEDAESAARAGEFDTFLFVRGEEKVLEFLKRAWSGLWNARALRSRAAAGPGPARVGGGVIVQRMVDARVSGVLETTNLAERELREIVINAGLGLGEGVVSGTVSADQAVVAKEGDLERGPLRFRYVTADKRERVIWNRRAGSGTVRAECLYHQRLRPALEYTELCELAAAAVRLEAAYGYPLDIEFALEGDRLWILQARPVGAFRAALRETLERHPLSRPSGRSAPESLEEIPS